MFTCSMSSDSRVCMRLITAAHMRALTAVVRARGAPFRRLPLVSLPSASCLCAAVVYAYHRDVRESSTTWHPVCCLPSCIFCVSFCDLRRFTKECTSFLYMVYYLQRSLFSVRKSIASLPCQLGSRNTEIHTRIMRPKLVWILRY